MRVLFVYSSHLCSCTKKRTFEISKALKRYVGTTEIHHSQLSDRLVSQHDLIVFQRIGANGPHITQPQEAKILSIIERFKKYKVFVYDIDDLVQFDQLGRPVKFMTHCDAVWTTTETLKSCLIRHNPKVFVLKNFVDTGLYQSVLPFPRPPASKLRVLWLSSGAMGGKIVEKLIRALTIRDRAKIEFSFMGDAPRLDIRNRLYLESHMEVYPIMPLKDMYSLLKSSSILINPLSISDKVKQDLYARCRGDFDLFLNSKSELKYLDAGLAGIPIITTPTEPYSSVITHGENGFLADSVNDWVFYLRRLINDHSLRARVGAAALKDVYENYNLDAAAKKYVEVMKQLVSEKGGPEPVPNLTTKIKRQLQDLNLRIEQRSVPNGKVTLPLRTGNALEISLPQASGRMRKVDLRGATFRRQIRKGAAFQLFVNSELAQMGELSPYFMQDNDWWPLVFEDHVEIKETDQLKLKIVNNDTNPIAFYLAKNTANERTLRINGVPVFGFVSTRFGFEE